MQQSGGVRLRVAIDGTPLLGIRTGVGHTTAAVIDALAEREELELVVYAVTFRGRAQLADMMPAGVRAATKPIPARLVRTLWQRAPTPGSSGGRGRSTSSTRRTSSGRPLAHPSS